MTAAEYLAERHRDRLAEMQAEQRATAKDDSYVGLESLDQQITLLSKRVIAVRPSALGGE